MNQTLEPYSGTSIKGIKSASSDVTENHPLICSRLAFNLSSKFSLNSIRGRKNN